MSRRDGGTLTFNKLYRSGRVSVGPCMGADTPVGILAKGAQQRRAVEKALLVVNARIYKRDDERIYAYVPTSRIRTAESRAAASREGVTA